MQQAMIARRKPEDAGPPQPGAPEGDLRFQAAMESRKVPLDLQGRPKAEPGEGQSPWEAGPWGDPGQGRPLSLNAAAISSVAMGLRAREWARALGRGTYLGRELALAMGAARRRRHRQGP